MQQRFEHFMQEIILSQTARRGELVQAMQFVKERERDGWELIIFDVQDTRAVIAMKRPYVTPEQSTP
jgi:hypothetical protein